MKIQSSDEEADKKKKKKVLEEEVDNKTTSVEKEEDEPTIPIEWVGEGEAKINGKLPGGQPKKAAKDIAVEYGEAKGHKGEAAKEKKGFLGKIKEKLPGYY